MKLLIVLVSSIASLITISRYASAFLALPQIPLPKLCDVSLPQHNNAFCKGIRNAALLKNKLKYTLKHDKELHGFALLNMDPLRLRLAALADPFMGHYTHHYLAQVARSVATLAHYRLTTLGKQINDISEYLKLSNFFQSSVEGKYTKLPSYHEAFNNSKQVWISDKLFTQQRLAGTNPMSIQRVTNHAKETVGLDWNKLKRILNPNFNWEAAVQAALKTEDSLEDAIKQGRIYALRYELCDDMERAIDKTDQDSRRSMWDFLSPIALFASANVGQYNELVPVAIQMDYKPGSPVFTPRDGDNWMIAKLNVQVTDLGYSQIVEHLSKIHYFIEPFCVCLKRTLPPLHPLNQMLKFHCREVIVPNTFGTPALTHQLGFVASLFGYGEEGAKRLIRDGHPLSTWDVTDYRRNIKKRGLDDKKLLPYFPYRDDGEKVLVVIEDMVKEYVNLYYKYDTQVRSDTELQAYINELSISGTGRNGGIGRIQSLPAKINTKKELCEFLSRIICHLTIQHAALNYELVDYASYVPNSPTKLYDDTRVEEGVFDVYRLPNRETASLQASFVNALGAFRYDTLYDYGDQLSDDKAKKVVNKFKNKLMEEVQPDLEEENEKRLKNGDLTYPYFLPKWLPNGIQT